jgi:hypothetical protein
MSPLSFKCRRFARQKENAPITLWSFFKLFLKYFRAMRRSLIQNQNGRLFHISAKVIKGGNQEPEVDLFFCLIRDRAIIGAQDAEQSQLFIARRKDPDWLACRRPRSRFGDGGLENPASVAKVKVKLPVGGKRR